MFNCATLLSQFMSNRREICPIHKVAEDIVKETRQDDITYEKEYGCRTNKKNADHLRIY
jgi:hypothetical protein